MGNPGPEYEETRHNVGFWVVDRLAVGHRVEWQREGNRLEAAVRIAGREVRLIRPLTFYNRSGEALVAAWRDDPFEPEALLACYDDLALPLGRLRLRPGGSDGGNKGIRSAIERLGTSAFPRLRVGIAPESGSIRDASEFVLSPFRRREVSVIEEAVVRAADAVECVLTEDLATAMNRYNPEP